MKHRQPCVYKITNIIDKKVYIGQTNVSFEDRVYSHKYELKKGIHKNNHLQKAVEKYGIENFSFDKIQDCNTNELDMLEIFWIDFFDSTNREFGYNFESGGNKNKKHHEESLLKMRRHSKQLWENEEYRQKALKRLTRKGSENNNARKVICIDTQEVFDTMTEAADKLGVSMNKICQVCAGSRLSTGGFQFAYYNEGQEYELKQLPVHEKGNHPCARRIICINDKNVFDSVIEASEFYGIAYANIHQVILGKNHCCEARNGEFLQFSYYEDGEEYMLKELDESKIKKPKKVICITTGELFDSTQQAAKMKNLQQSKISLVCNGKRSYHGKTETGEKLIWAFYEEHLSN